VTLSAGHVTVYCDACHHDIDVPVDTSSSTDDQPATITLHIDHDWLARHIAAHTTVA